MSLRTLTAKIHDRLHRHTLATKDELGTFEFCERRVPLIPWNRYRVAFRPADGHGWHPVPYVEYEDGETLLIQMIHAGSSHEAMTLLRTAYAQEGL